MQQCPTVTGSIKVRGGAAWPASLTMPDVMGWTAWVPLAPECRHGVVSVGGEARGTLVIDGTPMRVDGGTAYIEKDWGSSFPKSHVWLQADLQGVFS